MADDIDYSGILGLPSDDEFSAPLPSFDLDREKRIMRLACDDWSESQLERAICELKDASIEKHLGLKEFLLGLFSYRLKCFDDGLEHAREAARLFEGRGLEGDTDQVTVSRLLEGDCLFELGEYDPAIACYERVLENDPEHPTVLYNVGRAHLARGDLESAVRSFEESARVAPAFASSWDYLGVALAGQGHYDRALRSFEKALSIDSSRKGGVSFLFDLLVKKVKPYHKLVTQDSPASLAMYKQRAMPLLRALQATYQVMKIHGVQVKGPPAGLIEWLDRAQDV